MSLMVKVVRVDIDDGQAAGIPERCECALDDALELIGDKTIVSITQSQVTSSYDTSEDYRSNYVKENSIIYTIVYKV